MAQPLSPSTVLVAPTPSLGIVTPDKEARNPKLTRGRGISPETFKTPLRPPSSLPLLITSALEPHTVSPVLRPDQQSNPPLNQFTAINSVPHLTSTQWVGTSSSTGASDGEALASRVTVPGSDRTSTSDAAASAASVKGQLLSSYVSGAPDNYHHHHHHHRGFHHPWPACQTSNTTEPLSLHRQGAGTIGLTVPTVSRGRRRLSLDADARSSISDLYRLSIAKFVHVIFQIIIASGSSGLSLPCLWSCRASGWILPGPSSSSP